MNSSCFFPRKQGDTSGYLVIFKSGVQNSDNMTTEELQEQPFIQPSGMFFRKIRKKKSNFNFLSHFEKENRLKIMITYMLTTLNC